MVRLSEEVVVQDKRPLFIMLLTDGEDQGSNYVQVLEQEPDKVAAVKGRLENVTLTFRFADSESSRYY